eukprot:2317521-Pleurochrysis_carterae.AAC.5
MRLQCKPGGRCNSRKKLVLLTASQYVRLAGNERALLARSRAILAQSLILDSAAFTTVHASDLTARLPAARRRFVPFPRYKARCTLSSDSVHCGQIDQEHCTVHRTMDNPEKCSSTVTVSLDLVVSHEQLRITHAH